MSNTITIKSSHKEIAGNKVRLSFEIEISNDNNSIKTDYLYYETDSIYYDGLCENTIDGLVITFLSYAIRGHYNIVSNIGISSELYYNLTYHIIPQICSCNDNAHPTQINAPIISDTDFNPTAVATGMSCGVDSFTTLYEYTENCKLEDYKITHLTYFENGAHHLGKTGNHEEMHELFENQHNIIKHFCTENNFELITIKSNLNYFLEKNFWVDPFDRTHTYRNIGTALILQKLIRTYYYSSAFNINDFSCDLLKDSARYEKYLIPHIRTNSFKVYSSNTNKSRLEKTEYISQFPSSYDYLNVCYMSGENCGKCNKCIRTMLTLDALGQLEKYSKSFDLEYYNRNKKWYYTNFYYRKNSDTFTNDAYEYAKSHGMKFPLDCKIKGTFLYLSRKLFFKLKNVRLIRKIAYKHKPY